MKQSGKNAGRLTAQLSALALDEELDLSREHRRGGEHEQVADGVGRSCDAER